MSHGNGQHDSPAAVQPVRAPDGRFAPGNPAEFGKPFQPGQSGNPSGRPEGVNYPGDWLRGLCGLTPDQLDRIIEDDTAPASRIAAAMAIRDTMDADPATRRRALAAVMDRTEGKAAVLLNVNDVGSVQRSDDIMAEIAALVRANPGLRAHLADALDVKPALPAGGGDSGQG